MEVRLLLDTNAYALLMRGQQQVTQLVRRARELLLSAVVVGELMHGFRCGSRQEQNLDALRSFLDSPRISLIKGNNGIGEEIWREGKIVAMSDWELAALGDAAQDWAFSQGMLGLWDPDETLAHYEAAAGFKLSPRTMAFSQLFIAFKSTVCLNSALRGFSDGRDRRPGVAVMGISSPRNAAGRLASVVGMDIEEAAAALAAPRAAPSAYIREEGS